MTTSRINSHKWLAMRYLCTYTVSRTFFKYRIYIQNTQ